MNSFIKFLHLINAFSLIQSYTHDDIPKCFFTGVHKTRQTIIESPNYPDNYKADTCWDYVIRSPYKCPTKFHIQFLDFYLKYSKNCENDYLAIGLENDTDDMDILCGQVVGIKKYHTPDGVLRLRFFTDKSLGTTGKGFKLLITRLACETENILGNSKDNDGDNNNSDDDDVTSVTAPSESFQLPKSELIQVFSNLTGQEQYQSVPLPSIFEFNYPTQLPSPPYPATGIIYVPSKVNLPNYQSKSQQNNLQQPCVNNDGYQQQLPNIFNYYGALNGKIFDPYPNTFGGNVKGNYVPSNTRTNQGDQVQPKQDGFFGSENNGFLSTPRDQYIGSWSAMPSLRKAQDNVIDSLEACCLSPFQQKHFYLSSHGFPRTIFSNILPNLQKRDCVFRLQKSSPNVCRLRLDFKFFDFGQSYQGTDSYMGNFGMPAMQNTKDVCQEDFIEIDNQRFCGCRSGYTYKAYWTTAEDKNLRMRMGYSGVPYGGFLLELKQEEECFEAELVSTTTEEPSGSTITTINPSDQGQKIFLGQRNQNFYEKPNPTQQQLHHNLNEVPYVDRYQGQQSFLQNPLEQANYLGQQQQLFNAPGGVANSLQQEYPFLMQQQQQQQQQEQQSIQNNHPYSSQFTSNYFSHLPPQTFHHNIFQQRDLAKNSFRLPPSRYARSSDYQQPITVVETNSTRKEYYYSNNDSFTYNEKLSSVSPETLSKWDRKDINVNEKYDSIESVARHSTKCSFNMGDVLRLSVDILWITKPICYAPQRNLFSNWIG